MQIHRVLTLTLLAVTASCGDAARHAPLPDGTVALAFGDSVTYGTGASRGEDYPSRLAAFTGWDVVNAGIPGDTASAAIGRIEAAPASAPRARYPCSSACRSCRCSVQ